MPYAAVGELAGLPLHRSVAGRLPGQRWQLRQSPAKRESEWPRACVWAANRVRCLMKQQGLKARWKRKFVHTTDSRHELPIAQRAGSAL